MTIPVWHIASLLQNNLSMLLLAEDPSIKYKKNKRHHWQLKSYSRTPRQTTITFFCWNWKRKYFYMIICSAHFSAYRKIKADNHKLILSLECKIKTLDKGSHQKKVKKFHNKCELWGGGQQILVCEPQKSAFLELIFQKTCWN